LGLVLPLGSAAWQNPTDGRLRAAACFCARLVVVL